jgi:UDP-N-acetylglucosamine:LPS N-acetylglucosamine transferase
MNPSCSSSDQDDERNAGENQKVDESSSNKEDDVTTDGADAGADVKKDGDSSSNRSSSNEEGLKVLFLSSDTGGGHRASAESLAAQFEILFQGSSYDLLDLATEAYLPPYNSIVPYYKHLSAHPNQWKVLYGISNSKAMERVVETNIKVMSVVCERTIRKKIKAYKPDVVVSVHPLQTSVPVLSCAKISHETGKHLPMFTVVTDLGSAHSTWFAGGVEKLFVGSPQIHELARAKGIPEEKLVLVGLPIRHDFAVESERLGDRMSDTGIKYQYEVRGKLGLPAVDRKTLLVMGGGEGVGSLSNIVDALYTELVKQSVDAVIIVVCGRNEKLKKGLEDRDWGEVFQKQTTTKIKKKKRGLFSAAKLFPDLTGGCGDATEVAVTAGCIEAGGSFNSLRKILSTGSIRPNNSAMFIPSPSNKTEAIENGDTKKSGVVESDGTDDENKSIRDLETIPSGELVAEKGDAIINVAENERDDPSRARNGNHEVQQTRSLEANGTVSVVPLGFVKNMAEYMVAADVLISKAGPGTISEAAALSLPVMLTSFLPGQEEGNVGYVVEGGFGSFCQDTDTQAVAEEVALWLNDEIKLKEMSEAAKKAGHPHAARDIVKQIGDSTLKWKSLNDGQFTEIINSEDFDDDEKEKEAIAKIMAEEEKINADIIASAELTSTDENSRPIESGAGNGTI